MTEIEMTYTDKLSGTTEKLSAKDVVQKAIGLQKNDYSPKLRKLNGQNTETA